MIRSALLWPIKVGVIAAALWYVLRDPLPPPADWIVAVLAAVLLHLAYAAATTGARRGGDVRLLQKAGSGEPLEDGKRVALAGPLRTPSPLRAPFSGTECAGYSYEIFHFVYTQGRRGSTGTNRKVTDFSGIALAPSAIHTVQGDYPLLSYPFLSGFAEQQFRDEDHRTRAAEYIRAAALVAFVLFAPWTAIARVPGGSLIVEKQTERLKDALWRDDVREIGAAIRYLDPNLAFDEGARTPLMLAKSVEAADLLVKRGASVAAHDANGYSVLMNAAERGRPELLRFLVAHGADVNERLRTDASITPLNLAKDRSTPAAVDALARAGAR